MLEFLSGKRLRLKFQTTLKELSQPPRELENRSAGWGLRYDFRETRFEHEQVSFQAAVQTADGKPSIFPYS